MLRWSAAALLLLGAGCSRDDGGPSDAPTCELGRHVPITVQTSDGLTLQAELTGAGKGARGVLLLHMIPPQNDRSNYPRRLVDDLIEAGFTVLNLDRRGAGSSEGDPKAAYQGQNGRFDAAAGIKSLVSGPCAAPADRIAIIGASNGTTTAQDHAVVSAQPPAAMVYLSPGTYTENQNSFADHYEALAATPIFFGYPTSESDWVAGIRAYDQGKWRFKEYRYGDHGTKLFESHPDSTKNIIDFLGQHVSSRRQ